MPTPLKAAKNQPWAATRKERDLLEKLYITQRLTAPKIAVKLGWSERTVYHRLSLHGITGSGTTPKYCSECDRILE